MVTTRGLVRLTLAVTAPPLLVRRGADSVVTPFGRWMLERVASAMLDWPALAFHRVELTEAGVELVVIAGDHAPASAQFEAVATALGRELDVAARRGRWVREKLWDGVEVVVERDSARGEGRGAVGATHASEGGRDPHPERSGPQGRALGPRLKPRLGRDAR